MPPPEPSATDLLPPSRSRRLLAAGLGLLALGGAGLAMAAWEAAAVRHLLSAGRAASAAIIGVERRDLDHDASEYRPRIRFSHAFSGKDEVVEAVLEDLVADRHTAFATGDRIEVLFDPGNAAQTVRLKDRGRLLQAPALWLMAASVVAMGGIWVLAAAGHLRIHHRPRLPG